MLAVAKQLVNGRIKAEFNPACSAIRARFWVNSWQSPVSSLGRLQAARRFVRYFCQRGLHFRQALDSSS
ncbi:hypothetical protein O5541_04015 [Escherichia coli]|nr:hypothetical protein [Escherichia coli]